MTLARLRPGQSTAALLDHVERHNAAGPSWKLQAERIAADECCAVAGVCKVSDGAKTSQDRSRSAAVSAPAEVFTAGASYRLRSAAEPGRRRSPWAEPSTGQ